MVKVSLLVSNRQCFKVAGTLLYLARYGVLFTHHLAIRAACMWLSIISVTITLPVSLHNNDRILCRQNESPAQPPPMWSASQVCMKD